MTKLDPYRQKRDFTRSPEPDGARATKARKRAKPDAGGVFVVHKHAARRLHYDLRLEADGVLWSWAVTRGPSLDPDEKRLAVQVEDHPLDYAGFEGNIPKGGYGAGTVIVWDEGRWLAEGDPAFGLAKGHLSFHLQGEKLRGHWHLVRLKPRAAERTVNWLLMKVKDDFSSADGDVLELRPESVKSGRTIEEVAEAKEQRPVPAAKAPTPSPASRPARSRKKAKTGPASRSEGEPLPAFVPPCLATLQTRPPSGEDWLHEVKFDGYRLQARIDHGQVTLLTRTGLDWTARFGGPLSAALADLPCETALVDGEVVVLGDDGVASFSALQAALTDGRTNAMIFYAFDLLHRDGETLATLPLDQRKEALRALLDTQPDDGPLRYSEHFTQAGQTMLQHACRMGLEGVISKRMAAPYRSGRGHDWLKSKCTQRQEFVIGGYVPSKGSGRGLGSLVVGYHEGDRLKHAGRVGTGFSGKAAEALKDRLDSSKVTRSPFDAKTTDERGVVWVKPALVAEVEFRAWTATRMLRHASFQGLREDKPAEDVVAEAPADPVVAPAPARGKSASQRPRPAVETSVKLTNGDKVLWPDVGLTKRGLLDYYAAAWPVMRAFVIDRPLSLLRTPDGIEAHQFFQKHGSPGMHRAIHLKKDVDGEDIVFIRDFDGLAALVQLGVAEIHIWGAKVHDIERPDQIIFDLDPDEGVSVQTVREAAAQVRDRLSELGLQSWLKTSGGKGFHVMVAIEPKGDWTRVKGFARDFAKAMAQADPRRFTATLSKAARKDRIFIDYLRNGRGSTAIAPYSTRARPGAAVSMPVAWEALDSGIAPDRFRVLDILDGKPGQALTADEELSDLISTNAF